MLLDVVDASLEVAVAHVGVGAQELVDEVHHRGVDLAWEVQEASALDDALEHLLVVVMCEGSAAEVQLVDQAPASLGEFFFTNE